MIIWRFSRLSRNSIQPTHHSDLAKLSLFLPGGFFTKGTLVFSPNVKLLSIKIIGTELLLITILATVFQAGWKYIACWHCGNADFWIVRTIERTSDISSSIWSNLPCTDKLVKKTVMKFVFLMIIILHLLRSNSKCRHLKPWMHYRVVTKVGYASFFSQLYVISSLC